MKSPISEKILVDSNLRNESSGSTDSVNISEKYFSLVPEQDQKHLLNSLRNLEKRSPTTPPFKLYGKSDWSVVTDFLNSKEVQATHPPKWLIEYELSREDKFGAQGGHAPWSELRENAELYFSRPQECLIRTSDEVLRKYQQLYLLMQSAVETLDELKNDGRVETRANGWRLFHLKKSDIQAQRDALHLIKSGQWLEGWAYFFSRFNKQKKRLFVPMPFSANIRQGQWFNAFLKAIKKDLRTHGQQSQFAFWGDKIGFKPLFLEMMTSAVKDRDASHFVYVMRDFDKMDTSVGVSQKSHCFIPKLAAAYHYGEKSRAYSEMSEAMLFSNRCPIATPEGMWTGDHGEASGATVTNGGETCCNEDFDERFHSLVIESCTSQGITIERLCSYGNGDDGISIYYLFNLDDFEQFKIILKECAVVAAADGGYVIQAEKWDIHLGDYGKYCQYLPSFDTELQRIRMRYPAALILNAICNPVKQYKPADWDKDYRDHDIIDKLTNGFDLEYFHELIDYVDNGMKYRLLGRTEQETFRILSKWDKYRSLQPESRRFNIIEEEWENDITKNPVVRYILQKRGYQV